MSTIIPNALTPRKTQLLQFDTLDDRREISELMHRLPPRKRIAFLRWCCRRAKLTNRNTAGFSPSDVEPETIKLAELARWDSSADDMLTQEIYKDLFYLSWQFHFDLREAVLMLELIVRKS